MEKYEKKSADVGNEYDENVPFHTDMKAKQCRESAGLARSCCASFWGVFLPKEKQTY